MEIKQAAQALQVVFDKAVDSGIISRSAVEQGGKSALSAMDVISKARIPIQWLFLTASHILEIVRLQAVRSRLCLFPKVFCI